MTRLLTAAVLIIIVLFGIFGGPTPLLLVITALACITFGEFSQILRIPAAMRVLGVLGGLGSLVIPSHLQFEALLLWALLMLTLPLRYANLAAAFHHSGAALLGLIYVFGGFKTAYLLGLRSPWLLLLALTLTWVGDSGAYYVGRQFGKHKLAPRISPGKSWEGAAASALLSVLFFVIALPRVLPVSMFAAALLGLAGNVAGQLGDLSESALKRAAGVKDSGNLLPGHGGMLDRVDGVLFTLPVLYSLILALHL